MRLLLCSLVSLALFLVWCSGCAHESSNSPDRRHNSLLEREMDREAQEVDRLEQLESDAEMDAIGESRFAPML